MADIMSLYQPCLLQIPRFSRPPTALALSPLFLCRQRRRGDVSSPGFRRESLSQSGFYRGGKICDTGLEVGVCFQLRRGEGLNRSFQRRIRVEAFGESSRATSSSRGAWEDGISFNSGGERGSEEDGARWAQSIQIEPAVQPPFEVSSVQYDVGVVCLVLCGAFTWLRLFDFFTAKHILGQKLSRKIVHITSGLLYMLCWPFFSTSKWAPFIAGLVPLANMIRLLVYGFGVLKDEGLVKSMSRSGESRELLRGPLYYVLVLYFSTILFWRQSPVGVIALSLMCGGDGIADIMGRKFGSRKLPYNSDKSFAGSIAMFLFGFLVSSLGVYYFSMFGYFKLDMDSALIRVALISLAATIVESLPITTKLDDNFTVPATTFVLGMALFPMPS